MTKLASVARQLWTDESGISSVEYALLLAFVGFGVVAGAIAVSNAVTGEMNAAANCIEADPVQNADGTLSAPAAC